ncbi:glucosidase 2 subunit beta-like isoform X3 [Rutidosis leptorrhynchoides]|uniref:glucosidase 2 subunit beta-like isoform X3 n=1 Tax=Rutidosis leptorrhynchoides TaxID=125765 RepID=UPI003A9A572C
MKIIVVFYSILLVRSAVVKSEYIIGVPPQDEEYYKGLLLLYSSSSSSEGSIKCKDGSKTFTHSQLNDDFCDCSDGTDEPGTSACPSGKFYCRNAGHIPLSLFSSRVNDGICDCCDGSDEYNGKNLCKNNCWEAGKVARDRLRKKIATFQEGVIIRKHLVEQAKISSAKDEVELSRLKNEEIILKGLVQQLKDRKEQIEKAEEKERVQKEKDEKHNNKEAAEEAKLKERKGEKKVNADDDDETRIYDDHSSLGQASTDLGVELAHNGDNNDDDYKYGPYGSVNIEEEEHAEKNEEPSEVAHENDPSHIPGSQLSLQEEDGSEDSKSLSREELGRAIGSRWTGKKIEQPDEDTHAARDDDDAYDDETSDNEHDEKDSGYDTETEEGHPKYVDEDSSISGDGDGTDDDDDDDSGESRNTWSDDEIIDMSDMDDDNDDSTSNPSWLEKIQKSVRKFLQAVNPFQTPVDTSEAEDVRKEYDDASGKLSKMQSRISSLTTKLALDFGPEKEFFSLYGHCFEIKENKYVYKVCPFKEAIQVEGHSTSTRLGQWDNFDESYRVMLFTNGDKCWNGPHRSLTVRLRCGSKVEVADIDEPSRCEYSALLTTPALCQERRLKELQDKLESANKQQPHGHDEL